MTITENDIPRISEVVAASVVRQLQTEQLENPAQPVNVADGNVHWEGMDNERSNSGGGVGVADVGVGDDQDGAAEHHSCTEHTQATAEVVLQKPADQAVVRA